MKTVCKTNSCAGCMACIDICPKGAISIKDDLSVYNAVIEEDKCINCNACHHVCQSNHPAELVPPIKWYQGWAEDAELRRKCSSGGYATALSEAFIDSGGVVYGCTFRDGKFVFECAETKKELNKFRGSKYVKSNAIGVYKSVRDRLLKEQKVLFIGLPCQVSAMQNYVGKKLESNLYTIDLICHGTPSPKLLELFLKQYGYTLSELKNIQFRAKAKFMVYGDYKSIITNGVSDKYSIAFLNALSYTENCYSCAYARKERVSDITLGDSWGSELSEGEQKKGISLVLCQTEKGYKLLTKAGIHFESVDIDRAIASNHQLKCPSLIPSGREEFFRGLTRRNFNFLVFRQLPMQCLRQDVKQFLIKIKIIRWLKYKPVLWNIARKRRE